MNVVLSLTVRETTRIRGHQDETEIDMTLSIHSKPSNSGKRTVYFPTLDGRRINSTNFGAKWEAVKFGRAVAKLNAA